MDMGEFKMYLKVWKKDRRNHNCARRIFGKIKTKYFGGSGDNELTFHEYLFSAMFPDLKQQVVFGTGKGGYKKYGVFKYTADFYNELSNRIYEINGPSHLYTAWKDINRSIFFQEKYQIRVESFSHEEVEEMYYMYRFKNESFLWWGSSISGG